MTAQFDAAHSERHLFDVPRDIAYFNVAAMGPLLVRSRERGIAGVRRRSAPWDIGAGEWFSLPERRRAAFAGIIGSDADAVALVPAASYGFAVASANLAMTERQSILCPEDDFPSGVNSWRRKVAQTGGALRQARREAGESWTDAILRSITDDVAIVSVPPVRWTDGGILDLGAIGRRARAVGAALVVDATQWIGAAPFDVAAVDPDFLICAGYKWLLGPYGSSYLYVAPRHHEGHPVEENWIARQGSEEFARLAEHHPRYRSGARRFDAGEQVAFELAEAAIDAMEQIADWGTAEIARRLALINARIVEIAGAAGMAPADVGERAPHILSIALAHPGAIEARLERAGVHVSRRGGNMRISPHLHVDDQDLDRFAAALDA